MSAGDIFRLIFCFISFCAVLWGAYIASKWLASRSAVNFSAKFMKIIDRVQLTRESFLCIIQVGERYFLAGISSGSINLLSEIFEEDLTLLPHEEMINPLDSIYKLFEKAKKNKNGGFYDIFREEEENLVDRLINESRKKTDRLRKSDEDESDEEE